MPEISSEYTIGNPIWLLFVFWLLFVLLPVLIAGGWINWKVLNNPENKAFDRLLSWLREDNFGQLYLRFLGGLMDRVGDWIGDRRQLSQASMTVPQSNGLLQRAFGFNPFTSESYEKCLRLAFLYPLFSFFIFWAIGGSGLLGNLDWLGLKSISLFEWHRWLLIFASMLIGSISAWLIFYWRNWCQWLILAIIIFIFIEFIILPVGKEYFIDVLIEKYAAFLALFTSMYIGSWLVGWYLFRSKFIRSKFKYYNEDSKYFHGIYNDSMIASTTLAFFAIFVDTAIISEFNSNIANIVVAMSTIIIISKIIIFNGTSSVVLSFFFAFGAIFYGYGGAIFVGLIYFYYKRFIYESANILYWLLFKLIIILATILYLTVQPDLDFESKEKVIVLFWLMLPIVNAPLDWLSLGFTRGLLQAIRTGNHSGWRTLLWAAADLLLAFVFLLLITAVLVGVTALGNALAGKTLVDIGCILSNLESNSAHPDHWWIYFMLLSTLVPTLFHFALAGGAATLWLPRKWRTQLADGLEEDIHKTFGAWAYLTFTPVIGFILMPLALLWSLWWLLNTNGGALGTLLLNWATGLAQWADPAMMLSCSAG